MLIAVPSVERIRVWIHDCGGHDTDSNVMAVSNASTWAGPDLRRARRMADVTQEGLAAAIGVTRQRVANGEREVRVTPIMTARYLSALARVEHGAD